MAGIEVSQIWIYPLKSARGIRVQSAKLCSTGLENDRCFMLVEPKPSKADPSTVEWHPMTLRKWPRMGLLRTEIKEGNGKKFLHVFVKNYLDSIDIPLPPGEDFLGKSSHIPTEVDIWGALVLPYDMGDEYSKYFSTFLGTPCKLAYMNLDRPRYIQGNLPPIERHPVTGLSDGAPFLVCSEESMEDLNSRMDEQMSVIRFRPNIVLKGGKPYDEDNWAEIMVGNAGKFWFLSRSPRCQLPNVDVETGIKNNNFPYKALTKYRRIDKGSPYSPSFGMNAVAERIDGTEVHAGDRVTLLRIEEPRPYTYKFDTRRIS